MKDGLMQVVPQVWLFSEDELRNSSTNVYAGMYLLYSAWDNPTRNPKRSMHLALAAYNCGWEKLGAGRCGERGGFAYAHQVLGFWLPRFQVRMAGGD
jgi:soluble lytic murein transglycosylase-like protein